MFDGDLSRKQFLTGLLLTAASSALPAGALGQVAALTEVGPQITLDDLKSYEKIAGISFTDSERKELLQSVLAARQGFVSVRALPIENSTDPAVAFQTVAPSSEPHPTVRVRLSSAKTPTFSRTDQLAFASVRQLGELIRSKKISPVELTNMYLSRLEKHGDDLLCVVTLTPELAKRQAKKAEDEIMRGHFRGPLHGIPYGVKDLFAVKGYPTTWGAEPFEHQSFDYDCAVVERLEAAGAILVAKLSMGALALGDRWFRGRTKNPWNLAQGSSGSSAGSACATAAGLVAFALGTETLGSIMSPSHQCRVTGLRPTFGRISRFGAMDLSFTMDKIGPICRYAEDCAIVFAALVGQDPRDRSTTNRSFRYAPTVDLSRLKVAYLVKPQGDPEAESRMASDPIVKLLRTKGAFVQQLNFTPVPDGVDVVLGVEAASAFDAFTRGKEIDELKNSPWPQTFRENRYVPAVEYIQAQRARTLVQQRFEKELTDFDMILAANTGGYTLFITNLTGHPQVLIPQKPDETNNSRSRTLIGRLNQEGPLLAVAKMIQEATMPPYLDYKPSV